MLKTEPRLIGISGRIGSGKDTFAKLIQLAICDQLGPSKVVNVEKALEWFDTFNPSGWEIKKFAAKLKEVAGILAGVDPQRFEDRAFKDSTVPEMWWIKDPDYTDGRMWKPTYRELFLQRFGTEGIRSQHGNAWVNALFVDYISLNPWKRASMGSVLDYSDCDWPKWIITDVRFPNEIEAIKSRRGLLIRMDNRMQNGRYKLYSGEGILYTDGPVHISESALDDYKNWDEIIPNTGSLSDLYEHAKQLVEKYKLT